MVRSNPVRYGWNRMEFSKKALEELRAIIRVETGEEITEDEA